MKLIMFYQWAINNFPLNFNTKNEELSGIISTISSIVVHVFVGKFVGCFFSNSMQKNNKYLIVCYFPNGYMFLLCA